MSYVLASKFCKKCSFSLCSRKADSVAMTDLKYCKEALTQLVSFANTLEITMESIYIQFGNDKFAAHVPLEDISSLEYECFFCDGSAPLIANFFTKLLKDELSYIKKQKRKIGIARLPKTSNVIPITKGRKRRE